MVFRRNKQSGISSRKKKPQIKSKHIIACQERYENLYSFFLYTNLSLAGITLRFYLDDMGIELGVL